VSPYLFRSLRLDEAAAELALPLRDLSGGFHRVATGNEPLKILLIAAVDRPYHCTTNMDA
jgi:hypothetical protein